MKLEMHLLLKLDGTGELAQSLKTTQSLSTLLRILRSKMTGERQICSTWMDKSLLVSTNGGKND